MAQVACTTCGLQLDESQADITGRGYRCSQCTLRAGINENLGSNDVGDHLEPAERAANAQRALQQMIGGAAVAAICTPLYIVLPIQWFAFGIFAGIGLVVRGFVVRRQMAGHVVS
jgi:hypothetical protein